jgi:hypothetical protein
VAFITFVVIVSAFGLENIAKTRFFGIFMAFYLAFSAWVFIDMQIMFDVRNPVSETGKEVADFIKSGYKNEKYIVIHEISPHGFYEAALRFKQNNYGKNWDFDKVILISNFFMKDVLYSVFNAKIAKIFYSKQPGNRFPVVVYETDSAAAGREYFIKLKEKAFQADLLLWDFEYAKAAELCRNLETGIPGAGKEKFFNTIMRFIRFEACYELKDINCIIDSGYNNMDRIYATADFYYYRGKTAYMYGNRKRALESMYIAGKMAPWWNAPKTRILQMEKEK